MRTRIILFAMLLMSLVSYSQQDAQYTQYMYNTINVNLQNNHVQTALTSYCGKWTNC